MIKTRFSPVLIAFIQFSLFAILLALPLPGTLAQEPGIEDGEKLLVWLGNGRAPGQHDPDDAGELVYFNPDGSIESVLSLPEGTQRVQPCGEVNTDSISRFAFFIGGDEGLILLVQGTGSELFVIDESANAMACVSPETFQFSPDGGRIGYLDYPSDFANQVSPSARLYIANALTGERVADFENVAAFDLRDDRMGSIGFFYNADREAVEAAINLWDGSTNREIATLFANEENDCRYTSASVRLLPGQRMAAVMGYRCTRGDVLGPQWQFHLIDIQGRSATMALSGAADGNYFPFTRTNTVHSAPDGSAAFFTVPDGWTNRSTSVLATDLADIEQALVVDRYTVMPSLSVPPYEVDNHTPVASPDGTWLAASRNDPNEQTSLVVINLTTPDLPPIEISAGSRQDRITELLFTPDSTRLFFVAGGSDSANNSLFALDLNTGSDFRISRGRYGPGVMSPDGSRLAAVNWNVPEEAPPLLNLIVQDLESTATAVLFEGGEIVDGEVQNQRFAYPLSWRSED